MMFKEIDGSWTCSECNFNTKYNTTLKNHVEARHLRPAEGYYCQQCNKYCPTKNALKCHTYRTHNQKNVQSQKVINLILEELVAAIREKMKKLPDGLWACTDCNYQTKYSSTCQRHIESKHLETAGFQCSVCHQFCPTSNSLMSHQYRKHDIRYSQL